MNTTLEQTGPILTKSQQKSRLRRDHFINVRGSKCEKCDQDEKQLLHFHHIVPELKLFKLSGANWNRDLGKVILEVAKCQLLCVICHRKEHMKNG